jgi:hypothetical protein
MVGVMKEEGLCTPMMAWLYLEIARICAGSEDFVTAAKAARKALETYTTCVGGENERSIGAAKSVRAFKRQIPTKLLKK